MHALVTALQALTQAAKPLRLRRLERRPWQLLAQGLARHHGGYIWPTARGYSLAANYPL